MITVSDDRGFNDAADFGARHASMDTPAITMPNLSAMLAGFDHQPEPVRPGSFIQKIEAEANAWGAQFGERVAETRQVAQNYWGTPSVAPKAAPVPSLLDSIGNVADTVASNMTAEQPSVNTTQLGLSKSFGELGGSAFERRYQATTAPRKPGGNDYV